MVDPLSYFSLQPVLIGKSRPGDDSGFHLSLSEWSFTPYKYIYTGFVCDFWGVFFCLLLILGVFCKAHTYTS